MSGRYDDIIDLPHHVSPRHPPMSLIDRGAQFSPFAALTGYDAVIRETARQTEQPVELDESSRAVINEQLRQLADHVKELPPVTLTYFQPDERKNGGAYVTISGRVKKIDEYAAAVVFTDGVVIEFRQICKIEY